MGKPIFPSVYSTSRRGTTNRILSPKSGAGSQVAGMLTQTDVTVVGDKIFSRSNIRKFFEFQNKDAVNDMILAFGIAATATVGVLVGPLGSARWEIEVPSEEIHVFCAVAGAAFSWQERLA